MKTGSKIVFALAVAAMLFATVVTAQIVATQLRESWGWQHGLDIQFEHFEDGSGRLTYCLPWELCNEEYQEITVERRRK